MCAEADLAHKDKMMSEYSLNLITRKEFKTGAILSVDVTYTEVEWAKFDWKVSCILYKD